MWQPKMQDWSATVEDLSKVNEAEMRTYKQN
jgi:hypothetical protein